jgi:DNA-directed RNA polymerase subunit beta
MTKTLLRKLASVYDHVDIAPSPIRDKIREIAQFEAKFAELEMAEQPEMAIEPK